MDNANELVKLEKVVKKLQEVLDLNMLSMIDSNKIYCIRNSCMARIKLLREEEKHRSTAGKSIDYRAQEIKKLENQIVDLEETLNQWGISAEKGDKILGMIEDRRSRIKALKCGKIL